MLNLHISTLCSYVEWPGMEQEDNKFFTHHDVTDCLRPRKKRRIYVEGDGDN